MKNLILPLLLVASLLVGCATWQDNAGKTLATTAQSVDLAMRGWAAYVVSAKVSEDRQKPIREAYAHYQEAFEAARLAYAAAVKTKDMTIWEQASAVLSSEKTILLKLAQPSTP